MGAVGIDTTVQMHREVLFTMEDETDNPRTIRFTQRPDGAWDVIMSSKRPYLTTEDMRRIVDELAIVETRG